MEFLQLKEVSLTIRTYGIQNDLICQKIPEWVEKNERTYTKFVVGSHNVDSL